MSMGISSLFPAAATQIQSLPTMESMEPTEGGFGDVLKNALNQVTGVQATADSQVSALLSGGNADMSKVMISVEKADVAFQLMMQVRNKIVSAYQDIEKMQF